MGEIINLRQRKLPAAPVPPPVELKQRPAKKAKALPQASTQAPIAQTIGWHAPVSYHARSVSITSIAFCVIALAAGGFLLWRAEWVAGIALVLGGMALVIGGRTPAVSRRVAVHPAGIEIDDGLFGWDELKSFWIDYHPGGMKELSLEFIRWYRPHMRILLADQDPIALRAILLKSLPERQHPISLIDFWLKRY